METMKLSALKKLVHVERDGKFQSLGFIEDGKPNQLVFIEDAKYLHQIDEKLNITCVVTTPELALQIPPSMGIIVSDIPRKTFYEVHNYLATSDFYWKPFDYRIASSSNIDSRAYVAMRSVQIGERCEIGPNVSILPDTIIGDDVIIRAGSVIGTEGFKFERLRTEMIRVTHAGGVRIGNRVEIQANCCISKALFGGFTQIGDDSKLDNLVHVAHGVIIGKRCFIAACAMIAGNAVIGDDVTIGPSVAISAYGIVVGDGASVTIGSVVTKDVSPGQRVTGNFAIDHDKYIAFLKGIS